jgi:hypothetical protein
MAKLNLDKAQCCTQGMLGPDMDPGPVVNVSKTSKLPLNQSFTSNAPLQGKFPGGEAAQGMKAFDKLHADRSLIKSYAK